MFELLLVNPIFNVLLTIYALLPGNDLGLAVILLTILIRLLLWPLLKKQLHSQKAMRELQPEIKKIKEQAKGDRQKEGQMMLELYKEREIKPFASIGVLLIQLPILFALFFSLRHLFDPGAIAERAYELTSALPHINNIISGSVEFSPFALGVIDLSRTAIGEGIYLPALVLSIVTGAAQYVQSKQLQSNDRDRRRLRDILRDAKEGKEPKAGDQTAAMTSSMSTLLPVLTFIVSLNFPAALALYWATGSIVGSIQQRVLLDQDVEEMEESVPDPKPKKPKAKKAPVKQTPKKKKGKKGGRR